MPNMPWQQLACLQAVHSLHRMNHAVFMIAVITEHDLPEYCRLHIQMLNKYAYGDQRWLAPLASICKR